MEQVPERISFPEIKAEPDENCNDLQSGELGSHGGICATSSQVGNEMIRVQVEGISEETEGEECEPMTSPLTDPGHTLNEHQPVRRRQNSISNQFHYYIRNLPLAKVVPRNFCFITN